MSATFATVTTHVRELTSADFFEGKKVIWTCASKLNYTSEDNAFMLLSYSYLCSLFQLLIMRVHFVLIVFVKILESKDLLFS